jgi:hypothetical protein
MSDTSRMASRKWFATQVTALTALIVAWVNAGSWDKTLTIALVGLISQAIVGYLIRNSGPAKNDPQLPPPLGGTSAAPATAGTPRD